TPGQSAHLALPSRQAQGRASGPGSPRLPRPARGPPPPRCLPRQFVAELHLTIMNDHTLFLGKFLTQLTRGNPIASIAPSSRWLARTTVRNIAWDRARTLVELGAGTGPITRVLAERARPDCRVIVVERDKDFAGLLSERFGHLPNFEVVEGDAFGLARLL